MRFVDFTEVLMRKTEDDRVQVIHVPRTVIAETVCSVTSGAIPSELQGPQGQIITTPAAYLHFPGEKVLVSVTRDEALWKLRWENIEFELPGEGVCGGDSICTRKINKPKPPEEGKSSIIS